MTEAVDAVMARVWADAPAASGVDPVADVRQVRDEDIA